MHDGEAGERWRRREEKRSIMSTCLGSRQKEVASFPTFGAKKWGGREGGRERGREDECTFPVDVRARKRTSHLPSRSKGGNAPLQAGEIASHTHPPTRCGAWVNLPDASLFVFFFLLLLCCSCGGFVLRREKQRRREGAKLFRVTTNPPPLMGSKERLMCLHERRSGGTVTSLPFLHRTHPPIRPLVRGGGQKEDIPPP
jgi:hypothetical protein